MSKLALLRAANEHIVRLERRVNRRDDHMEKMRKELEALRLEVGVGVETNGGRKMQKLNDGSLAMGALEEADESGEAKDADASGGTDRKLSWKGMELVDLDIDIDAPEDADAEKAELLAAARPTERAAAQAQGLLQ